MGFGCSESLSMIFIIITMLMLLSLQRTHILNVDALWNEAEGGIFHVHDGLRDMMYSLDEKEKEKENGNKQIKKISGLDEYEEKQAMIVERFRALLGLKSFHSKRVPSKSDSEILLSPSPSPSPSPMMHVHHHSYHHHHPMPHTHWNPSLNKNHHEDRGRAKKILVAVLVSVGIATLLCAFGLIFGWMKLKNHTKKPKRTMPLCSKNKESGESTYQNSSSNKVSLNSGLDLFYLDSLGEDDIEQQQQNASTLKKSCEKNDNVRSSSTTKEILPVHHGDVVESSARDDDESESDEGKSSSSDDKIIVIPDIEECHSSDDDESFHSLDSQSNTRLSNASAGSSIETMSMSPKNSTLLVPNQTMSMSLENSSFLPNQIPSSHHSSISNTQSHSHQQPYSPKNEKQEIHEINVQCVKSSISPQSPPPPPPPPPPPTPPLRMPLFRLHSLTSSSSRASSPSPISLKSHNLSSPRNSDRFSVSNQSPEKDYLLPSPPPPSQPAKSPPPPPCPPPPFLKGINNNSTKTPPPPPSQLPQFTALGKDGAPLPKLKPLHWDKVRAAPNRTMVWDKLRSSSFELDEEMIESLFGYNLQSSIKNDETKSKSPSPSKHVLEPKRLQNITILSKALNATSEHVCEALIQGKGLCLQQLEALVKMVPTKEEEAKLANYKGNINELGSAERFVRAMLQVPFAFQRVEAMLYKDTFEDEVVHLKNSFSMLEEACKELRSSRLFLKLLETVLKTGNRMNVGTIRGGARAFKLDALLKLADVKGIDGKTTLLHFVVQEIVRSEGVRVSDSIMGKICQKTSNKKSMMTEEEKEDDYRRMGLELVSGLSTELYNVKKTATIDLDVLASSVSNLFDGMSKLKHLVENELHDEDDDEVSGGRSFVKSMKSFLSYAGMKMKELQGDEDRVMERVKEITEYFHGDVSKEDANPLRIFVIVRDFLGMLDSVCKELRKNKAPKSPNPLAPFR